MMHFLWFLPFLALFVGIIKYLWQPKNYTLIWRTPKSNGSFENCRLRAFQNWSSNLAIVMFRLVEFHLKTAISTFFFFRNVNQTDWSTTVLNHPQEIKKVPNGPKVVLIRQWPPLPPKNFQNRAIRGFWENARFVRSNGWKTTLCISYYDNNWETIYVTGPKSSPAS